MVEIPVRIAGEWQSMRIYYFKPHRYHADRPMVFVMHGVKRNADVYRNAWKELARQHNLLVVVPEFSKKNNSPAPVAIILGMSLREEVS